MGGARFFVVAVLLASVAWVVVAAERPILVSPGDASKLVLIESRCPTFSWGGLEEANTYELLVYVLGGDGHDARPVLTRRIPGAGTVWTPPLDHCFKRGGQYAWTVRAHAKNAASEWSIPNLFEVAAGPSEAEFEAALDTVQEYLSLQGEAVEEPAAAQLTGHDRRSVSSAVASPAEDIDPADAAPTERGDAAPAPSAPSPRTSSLVTEGAIAIGAATPLADLHVVGDGLLGSFLLAPDESVSGDDSEIILAEDADASYGMHIRYDGGTNQLQIWGRNLSGENGPWLRISRDSGTFIAPGWKGADPPCFGGSFFNNCNNGTVTDNQEALIWLENANCFGLQTFADARDMVAALKDGECGLSDGSHAGDWRLPTREDWDTLLVAVGNCVLGPPAIVGDGTCCHSVPQCEWASNVQVGNYWSMTFPGLPPGIVYQADTSTGSGHNAEQSATAYVWPVRSGR